MNKSCYWLIIGMLLLLTCHWGVGLGQELTREKEIQVSLKDVKLLVAKAEDSKDKTYKELEKSLYQLGPEAIVYFFRYTDGNNGTDNISDRVNDEMANVFNQVILTYKKSMSGYPRQYEEAFETFDANESYKSLCIGLEDIQMSGAGYKAVIVAKKLQKYNLVFVCKKLVQALEQSNFPLVGTRNVTIHRVFQEEIIKGVKNIIGEDFDSKKLNATDEVKKYIDRCKSILKEKEDEPKDK